MSSAGTLAAWRLLALVVLLLVLPHTAAAQQARGANDAAGVRAYWQALQQATSVADASAARRGSWAAGGAGELLAEALLLLRRYELTSGAIDASLARRAAERAAKQASESAWAQFALGVVLAHGPDVRIRAANGSYFVDPHSNAAAQAPRALRRALELDPTFHEAAFELATLALDLNRGDLLTLADSALRTAPAASSGDVLLLRAKIAERLDAPRSAAALADSARLHGVDAAVAAHERARSLFRLRGSDNAALAVYFSGVDALGDAGADVYFRALEPILDAAEIAQWQALDIGGRRQWLREYWEYRAALAGVPVAERLGAHYRRLYEARALFPMTQALGAHTGADDVVDARAFGLTAAGLLHVRHGDAARVARFTRCGFAIDTLPPLLRPGIEECVVPVEMRGLAGWQVALSGAERRLRARQTRERALRGESYHPPFVRDVPVAWELFMFRGADGRTEVVAAVAAPAAALGPPITTEIAFVVADRETRRVQRAESLRRAMSPTAAGDVIWTTSLDIEPGDKAVRVSVSDSARQAGRVARADVTVRSFARVALSISDLVMAPRDGVATWWRGGVQLALAPRRDYVRSERFELYYEVYGLGNDVPYRTEIILAPDVSSVWERLRSLAGALPDVVRLSFDERASGVHERFGVQQLRTIDAGALSPGRYRLSVVIRDMSSGRSTTTERVVVIR